MPEKDQWYIDLLGRPELKYESHENAELFIRRFLANLTSLLHLRFLVYIESPDEKF